MTKAELVEQVANDAGATQASVEDIVDRVIDAMSTALAESEVVELRPFGRFVTRLEGEHEGTDPNTHEPITIPAHTRVLFHPSTELRDLVKPESGSEES
jgi:DNA-binding protein HU-beta